MNPLVHALQTGRIVSRLGRIFLSGTLVVSGHPGFDEPHVIAGALTGHYHAYASSGMRGQVTGVGLLYEDIRSDRDMDLQPEPSHRLGAAHRPLILTTSEGYAAIAADVDRIHDALIDHADDIGHEVLPGITLNGRRAQAITVETEDYLHVHQIILKRNGQVGGYWLACGQPRPDDPGP